MPRRKPKLNPDLERLSVLYHATQKIQNDFKFHSPGRVLRLGVKPLELADVEPVMVVVEANGFGQATVTEVTGCYPNECEIVREHHCESEQAAIELFNQWRNP